MFLIDDLLLLPVSGIKFILSQIQTVADRELNDETSIKTELLELQMRLEIAEISEEEYREREADVFARLRAIKERQMEMLGEVHTSRSSLVISSGSGDDGPS